MKQVIFAFAVVMLSAAGIQAQSTAFGIKAGMTAANLKFSGEDFGVTIDTKIGFYAGVFADIGVCENFAVSPELFYSALGAKLNDEEEEAKIDLGYINLPILAKYKKDGLSLFLGPQISYLISAKEKFGSESDDVKEDYKSTDFSGVIGAGYTLMNGFGFDARYQFGLSDIIKENEGDGKLKNNSFMVGVHYMIRR